MFSYRHAFHAGNHADVLKHSILLHTVEHFARKDTPFWVIDTHAGAGLYALDGDWATKRGEFEDGIGRVWSHQGQLPPLLDNYRELIRSFNEGKNALRHYPGSPWVSLSRLRPTDRLRLFELHPSEVEVLVSNLEASGRTAMRQTTIFGQDGFEGVKALLPVPSRRSLVLIDPPYEDKTDYRKVVTAVNDAIKRYAPGTIAVWYPIVSRVEAQELPRKLQRLPVRNWLNATLTVRAPAPDGRGLHGSGMFLINQPWTLAAALKEALPWMARQLALDGKASYTLDFQQE